VTDAGRRDWVEIAATVLLALAAVATAWSSYQAARWNGEQSKASSANNRTRIQAARAAGLANAQTEIDVATFTQWVDAYALGRRELAAFYRKRFRLEFKPAVEAWIATRPLTNPSAPLTPFVMPQYRLAARTEAERLDARAEGLSAAVRRDIQRSTNYVLGVVLFAVALFFAAMCTKLTSPSMRIAALGLGTLVFLTALAWIATSPVSFSV
jgi:TRAP-type C4-dicarboxylate transport system permease small subunit